MRILRDACNVHPSARQLDEEKHIIQCKADPRSDLHREQIGRGNRTPMRHEEGRPRRPVAPFGRGFDTALFEDVSNRLAGDGVTEVSQRSFDRHVAPVPPENVVRLVNKGVDGMMPSRSAPESVLGQKGGSPFQACALRPVTEGTLRPPCR